MHNELTGRVTGASFQIGEVHGDVVVDVGTTPPEPDRGRTRSQVRPPSNARFAVAYFTTGVLFIVIFTAVSTSWGGRAPQAESPGSPRPAGVEDNAVVQVTVNELQKCTAAMVSAPLNCPQSNPARFQATSAGGSLATPATPCASSGTTTGSSSTARP